MATDWTQDLEGLPLERIARYAGGELDAAECRALEAEAESSPALAAELALARQFRDADLERVGVDEIVGRLGSAPATRGRVVAFERRPVGPTASTGAPWGRTLRLAAMLAVVVGGGVLVGRLTAPPPVPLVANHAVRGSQVEILAPAGEISEVPRELTWRPLEGSSATRVRLRAASGEVLLDEQVEAGRGVLELPEALHTRLAAGLRWSWAIEAIDAEGRVLARSEVVEVRPASAP